MKVVFGQVKDPREPQRFAPLWAAYLKAYASQYVNAEWHICYSPEEAARLSPDVLALSVNSQDWDEVPNWITAGGDVVIGGHHVTGVGRAQVQEQYPEAEVIVGPGEAAFTNYLLARSGSHIRCDPPENLDDIPIPDHTFGVGDMQPHLITSRGCPYVCSFCSPKNMWRRIKFHSAERVVEEIKIIRNHYPDVGTGLTGGRRVLMIWDDLFAANLKRVQEISDALRRDGINIKFWCGMRPELVTADRCAVYKEMGLTRIYIGAESGVDSLLKKLKSDSASVAKNQQALDAMAAHGIEASANILLGHWDETERDVIDSYEWLLKNYREGKLQDHELAILTPFPATPLWDQADGRGLLGRDLSWRQLRYYCMKANPYRSRREWMIARRRNGSIYLNEHNVPQESLYRIIDYYEGRIAMSRPDVMFRTAKRWVARHFPGAVPVLQRVARPVREAVRHVRSG